MKILTFSSLYPNSVQANHGVFVENRLRHLVADGRIESRVVAPVPWFPSRSPRFGHYAKLAAVPRRESRHGIEIDRPRYPVIPKLGMSLAPLLMYAWSKAAVARLLDSGYDFDLIDAHYFYPDGVAAVLLGRHFGKPVTITARGTDLNVIPDHALPRRMTRWAAGRAAGVITVSAALSKRFRALGFNCSRLRVLRNGVDLRGFRPVERTPLIKKLGVESPILLSVGNLLPAKGHDLAIRALPHIPGATLLIAGQGPDENRLRKLAETLDLAPRVMFLGTIPHASLHETYNTADVLVLASAREGWPNVLLEAMACGTPVAASHIPGIPEVVASPAAGRLIPAREPEAIAKTIRDLLADPPSRAETRTYAEGFSWDETTEGQIALFQEILAEVSYTENRRR
jgi:glycosyltransferase involved in cell wall biosynthesis